MVDGDRTTALSRYFLRNGTSLRHLGCGFIQRNISIAHRVLVYHWILFRASNSKFTSDVIQVAHYIYIGAMYIAYNEIYCSTIFQPCLFRIERTFLQMKQYSFFGQKHDVLGLI